MREYVVPKMRPCPVCGVMYQSEEIVVEFTPEEEEEQHLMMVTMRKEYEERDQRIHAGHSKGET